jgi:outer membrane protein assembly factor BamA
MGLAVLAQAQLARCADNAWPLVSARCEGSVRFPETDIVAATGLKSGAKVTLDDFKRAADKLVASGAFERVAYRYSPDAGGIKLVLQVEDAPQFLAVSFDNFVWCADRELIKAVHKRVPLFDGELPLDGDLTDQVTKALQEFLEERGIPGEVRFQPQSEQSGNANSGSGIFWIEGIEIPVRAVDFPGAPPADISSLQTAAKPLLGVSFRRSAAEAFISSVLQVYLQQGFLKARFAPPSVTLASSDPRSPAVTVSYPVTPGPQYRLGGFRWAGNHALDSSELGRIMTVKIGAFADPTAIDAALERARQAYRSRGYLHADVHAVPSYDDSMPAVSYELQVQEGPQYKFAGVELEGLAEGLRERVRDVWSLREGEPYDPNYIAKFLKAAEPLLGPGAVTRAEPTIDDQALTVEVLLHFDFQKPLKENPKPAVVPKR